MKDKNQTAHKLKLFGMQNFMLEGDLEKLEKSGIEIGHIQTLKHDEIVDTELFEYEIRTKAKKMADFYILYYCLENTVRKQIEDTLREEYGPNWFEDKVPDGVKKEIKKKQDEEKDSAMSFRSENPLAYTNFGELIGIINFNWTDFSDIFRSQKAMESTLSQFNKIRNIIAHSCSLNDDEILRFKLLTKDWLRIQI